MEKNDTKINHIKEQLETLVALVTEQLAVSSTKGFSRFTPKLRTLYHTPPNELATVEHISGVDPELGGFIIKFSGDERSKPTADSILHLLVSSEEIRTGLTPKEVSHGRKIYEFQNIGHIELKFDRIDIGKPFEMVISDRNLDALESLLSKSIETIRSNATNISTEGKEKARKFLIKKFPKEAGVVSRYIRDKFPFSTDYFIISDNDNGHLTESPMLKVSYADEIKVSSDKIANGLMELMINGDEDFNKFLRNIRLRDCNKDETNEIERVVRSFNELHTKLGKPRYNIEEDKDGKVSLILKDHPIILLKNIQKNDPEYFEKLEKTEHFVQR